MKKLLALVLALVMSMSLVTISNAAFKDADKIDYKEAVDVMNAVGVFVGDENGNFNAKANLTREQAAKIIAYLDLGEDIAEALPAVKVFNDVEASRWSAKYIAYCADAGYIAGIGNGNFDPAGKLTGYAFGKMLLCALGYDADYEQLTGSSWQINVAKLMKTLDIAKSVSKIPSAVLTREEAAQYTLTAYASVSADQAAGVLYVADKTDLKELYIVAANERVGAEDTAVYGNYVKTGDANYNTEDKVLVNTIVFNVDGKDTEYQIKNSDLGTYEGLYKLEVKDGYVDISTTGPVANATIQSVGDGYVVISDTVIKLADTCGIYDATDKEAIAEGSLNEGDIVSYTVSDSKINRIYVAYAAQDDGVIKGEKTAAYAAYLKSLGYNDADAASHSALGKNGVLVKFTVDAALSGNLTVDVKNTSVDPATTFTYTFGSVNWLKDSTHSVMIDLLNDYNSNHSGTAYPVGSYEVVVKVDSTEVASYTFSVEA